MLKHNQSLEKSWINKISKVSKSKNSAVIKFRTPTTSPPTPQPTKISRCLNPKQTKVKMNRILKEKKKKRTQWKTKPASLHEVAHPTGKCCSSPPQPVTSKA